MRKKIQCVYTTLLRYSVINRGKNEMKAAKEVKFKESLLFFPQIDDIKA